jgi:hypothetical protein
MEIRPVRVDISSKLKHFGTPVNMPGLWQMSYVFISEES